EEERARTKQAEEEQKGRELARRLAIEEKKLTPDGLPILSGFSLRDAKERLLAGLFARPDMCRSMERQGITRDHFCDDPKFQEAFDTVRSGADIKAIVDQNPICEIARLQRLANRMRAIEMSSLARQIVASVRAKQAADKVSETNNAVEPDHGQSEAANKPIATTELAPAFDYASVLPECLPLLADVARLKTLEQKLFDNIPTQIAFEREHLAPKRHNLSADLVEGKFEEIPVAPAQLLPDASSSAPVPP